MCGLREDHPQRYAGFNGDAACIFVLGGKTIGADLDADNTVASGDIGKFTGLDAALGGVEAEAEGGGFAED